MTPSKRICTIIKSRGRKDKLVEQSQPTLQKVTKRVNPLPKDSKRWQTVVEGIGNFIACDM